MNLFSVDHKQNWQSYPIVAQSPEIDDHIHTNTGCCALHVDVASIGWKLVRILLSVLCVAFLGLVKKVLTAFFHV